MRLAERDLRHVGEPVHARQRDVLRGAPRHASPARHPVVAVDDAGGVARGADRDGPAHPGRSGHLPHVVGAPAVHRPLRDDGARVPRTDGDRARVGRRRRAGLARSPAGDGAVVSERTGVRAAGRDGGNRRDLRRGRHPDRLPARLSCAVAQLAGVVAPQQRALPSFIRPQANVDDTAIWRTNRASGGSVNLPLQPTPTADTTPTTNANPTLTSRPMSPESCHV